MIEPTYFNNPLHVWVAFLIVTLVTIIILGAMKKFALSQLKRYDQSVDSLKNYPFVAILTKTHRLFLIIASLFAGSFILSLPDNSVEIVKRIMIAALAIQSGLWGSQLILYFIHKSELFDFGDESIASGSVTVISFVGNTILWSIIVVFLLGNLGFNVSALVTGLGIGGVAVALAVQNILGDLFASLSIVVDKPFAIGDLIIVDEFKGHVEHIGLKTTRLRSTGGEQLIFSNTDLLKSRIRNFKRMRRRRVEFQVAVATDTEGVKLARIPQIMQEIINATAHTTFERAFFVKIGDWANEFEVVYFVEGNDTTLYLDVQQQINLKVLEAFRKEDIHFGSPPFIPK